MVSHLRDIISEIAEKNEIKIEGFKMNDLAMAERHLNENEDVAVAITELRKILGFEWKKYYSEIEKQLERNKK